MALWGNIDAKESTGTVTLDYTSLTVTGSGTSFGQVGSASTGDVIRFGDINGTYYGDSVIIGITSDRVLSIASTSNLSGDPINGVTFSISQLPKYTTLDSHYKVGVSTIYDALVYGVDKDEAKVSKTTSYEVTHSGWVGVTTYLDWEGNLRVKNEVLVAMSSIEADADDDSVFPDTLITIISQPSSVAISTDEDAIFTVGATIIPSTATLSYQWQVDDGTGFEDLSDDAEYDGSTTNSLLVSNDSDKDGYDYRVIISSGDNSVISETATINYN